MSLDIVLAVVGALAAVVAALSARIRRMPVSEPLLGLLAGVALGPQVTAALELPSLVDDHTLMHEAARILLAVSVMAVALRYPIASVRRRWRQVTLLLLVALPSMALVTGALGWALLGLPVAAAALVGAALAPTDPVLAASVVTGDPAERDLPAHDRQLLSLESGANDGLALPLVVAAIAVAGPLTGSSAVAESVWQVVGGIVLGLAAGWVGGRALRLGEEHGATASGPVLLFTLVLALGVLGLSGLLKVDGVLAVFVAGLAFNAASTGNERVGEVSIDEAVNRFAVLPLFLLLGATLPWQHWAELGWRAPVLALGVLALRRLPVVLLLKRPLGLGTADVVYLGWFGPVGVSALFYLTLEAERLPLEPTLLAAGSLVVVASTVAHALTGAPGRVLFRRAASGRAGQQSPPSLGTDGGDHLAVGDPPDVGRPEVTVDEPQDHPEPGSGG